MAVSGPSATVETKRKPSLTPSTEVAGSTAEVKVDEVEETDSDYEVEDNRGGMKLRDLQASEYSWLKREHWWCVGMRIR